VRRGEDQPDPLEEEEEDDDDDDVASSRAVSVTPQKCDCCPSPEQVNPRTTTFRRPTLPELVRARSKTRRPMISGSCGFCKC
jgi:hypothetical protein